MYDLHNHLLPGIDDGARDLSEALQMAEQAVKCGVTHMVCTPHIHIGHFNNDIDTISAALEVFHKGLQENNIPLKIAAAAEVRLGAEIIPLARQRLLPVLGDWKGKEVLLVEFPANSIPFGSTEMLEWLLSENYVPMIAHPERNRGIIERPAILDQFMELGCLSQVTLSALTGNFGRKVREMAVRFLEEDKVTIMASDAHNMRYRPPVFGEAIEHATSLIGAEGVKKLLVDNPKEISQILFE